MKKPSVSIIMPLYNKENEVNRAVQSVLSQTFQDFEIIVVNDGATDGSVEVVEDIEDVRLRIIHQANSGVSAARNRGIESAKYDLIAFLDADDEWLPEFLDTIVTLKEQYPSCSVFATGYFLAQKDGYRAPAVLKGLPYDFKAGILEDYFGIACQSDPPLWTSAVAITKTAIKSVGSFPEGISAGEDLLTWARLAVRYKIAYSLIPKAIFYAPDRMEDRPSRRPQIPDQVAEGLRELLNDSALTTELRKGLAAYIGLWHRMRAVIYIKLNSGNTARREIHAAIRYSGFSLRLVLLLILAFLPSGLMADLFHKLNRFRYALSNINTS